MAFSLYSAVVPSYRQILTAVGAILVKAEAFCAGQGITPEELIQTRLAPDMHPFGYQVKSTCVHSLGALEGVRLGTFSADRTPFPTDFAALRSKLEATLVALEALDPAEIDSYVGRDMYFTGRVNMHFTAEEFLLSFAQPNFYFHATTAYDILRWKGMPLGKRDFIGAPRVKV